jgi:uncharacterized protein YqjF (DUF2071 family)
MRQVWTNLLFLHWRFSAEVVQRTLPRGLTVDVFDGVAWIGVVPFFMRDVHPRGLPPVGRLSNFLELNVRTYVHDEAGRPGVWFYSLDCNQSLAVWLARKFFHLPYVHAEMAADIQDGRVHYRSRKKSEDEDSRYVYATSTNGVTAEIGSLEFFLVERYLLFSAAPDGTLFCGRVWHEPYRIEMKAAEIWSATPLSEAGFNAKTSAPVHSCVTAPVHVRVFGLEKVGS